MFCERINGRVAESVRFVCIVEVMFGHLHVQMFRVLNYVTDFDEIWYKKSSLKNCEANDTVSIYLVQNPSNIYCEMYEVESVNTS
jgi:hypothetical protein